jgi:hypothetical protein
MSSSSSTSSKRGPPKERIPLIKRIPIKRKHDDDVNNISQLKTPKHAFEEFFVLDTDSVQVSFYHSFIYSFIYI